MRKRRGTAGGAAIQPPERFVAERTFCAVAARKQPEDFAELRQMYEQESAEDAQAELLTTRQRA